MTSQPDLCAEPSSPLRSNAHPAPPPHPASARRRPGARADELVGAPLCLATASRYANFAAAIFAPRAGSDATPLLLGCLSAPELQPLSLSLRQARHLVLHLARELERRGIEPGDTVALLRLPRTCETLTALAYLALSAYGARVLFPMCLEPAALAGWLRASGAKLVLASLHEVERIVRHEGDVATARAVRDAAAASGVPLVCLYRELGLVERLGDEPDASPSCDDPLVARMLAVSTLASECALLTTSGTNGAAKLVRFRQGAFLRSAASWEQAGFFRQEALGGAGLTLLLGHSMGLRALWNAVWTGAPLCLVTPEWFLEYPERVRSLLAAMSPTHVTGGPAVFETLLALARRYPDLKASCFPKLRCLVSSGTAYDQAIARRVEATFGLPLHNALGLTETMQVACTLAGGAPPALGLPLPGVRLRLVGDPALPADARRLLVASPFQSDGYLGEAPAGEWLDTGDVVSRTPDGGLSYLGRAAVDFLNDAVGVKIARSRLEALYGRARAGWHVEFHALRTEPGVAALVFVGGPSDDGDPLVTDPALLGAIQSFFEERMERMQGECEAHELRHLAVARFAAVRGAPPRTAKGTARHGAIAETHARLLATLTGRPRRARGIVRMNLERTLASAAVRLTSPKRGELLRLFALDKRFVRGRGDRLYYAAPEGEREVVDFVGGFGGNLLGHAHPALAEVVAAYAAPDAVCISDQGAERVEQGELARQLARVVGACTERAWIVRLGSTGSEAVEMALAHAVLEREEALRRLCAEQRRRFGGRFPERVRAVIAAAERIVRETPPQVLALEGAFHGYSLGARAVLGREADRAPFASLHGLETIFVSVEGSGDVAAIVARARLDVPILAEENGEVVDAVACFSRIIAAIAEPIQGEGGMRVVPPARLGELAGHGFPLILDEIQCGLGRSGRLLASEGVPGDYYLFGKALGGGVAKVSALLVERRRYVPRFDELYAGTFAGDPLSSAAASRVLAVIAADDVPRRAAERGAALRRALERVRARHPQVLRDVRGEGLMLAFELDRRAVAGSFALRAIAAEDCLGALCAAYLLNERRVRVLPSLSAPDVLRLEPSAYVDDGAIAELCGGLDAFCRAVRAGDVASLVTFLVGDEAALAPDAPAGLPRWRSTLEPPAEGAVRVAFVSHFVVPERELAGAEPSLQALPLAARRALYERLGALCDKGPILGFARNLFGGRVWFLSIVMAVDAATLEELHGNDDREHMTARIQRAVELAAAHGCTTVALGGYTSILARNGEAILPPRNVRITSGNTFTCTVAMRRLREACHARGIDPAAPTTCVGVVGATGNIGSSFARCLASGPAPFGKLLLVSPRREALEVLRQELVAAHPGCAVEVATELAPLRACNAIAIAVGTNEPLLYPEHLAATGDVVIADVSVPGVVSAAARARPGVHQIAEAGLCAVPGAPDFVLSLHTPEGTAFCCAAELMLLGLEPARTAGRSFTGDVAPENMRLLEALATEHGFFSQVSGAEMSFHG
ncbi:MAG: aminotransferase class III-fold pyridoxal phosphate-dependent enzyme [Polyangiaceae bacterium]|nr:aminotransferase class III-fold pyridoxal phosphate-dependent enzyme [Polyangiaceae bacterium]